MLTVTHTDKGEIKKDVVDTKLNILGDVTLNGENISDKLTLNEYSNKTLSSQIDINHENINQTKAEATQKSWNESTTSLTTFGSLLLSAVVSFATAGIINSAVIESVSTALGGVSQAVVGSVLKAGTSSLLNQLGTGVLTGDMKFDLGATLQSMASAGITAGVTPKMYEMMGIDSSVVSKDMSLIDKAIKSLTDSTIDASVSSFIYGTNFGDTFVSSLQGDVVDNLFTLTGDYSLEQYKDGNKLFDEGAFGKVALHTLTGCAAAEITRGECKDGAVAAMVREMLSPLTSLDIYETDQAKIDEQIRTQQLVSEILGMSTGYIVGGDEGAVAGHDVALSAEIYNRQQHWEYERRISDEQHEEYEKEILERTKALSEDERVKGTRFEEGLKMLLQAKKLKYVDDPVRYMNDTIKWQLTYGTADPHRSGEVKITPLTWDPKYTRGAPTQQDAIDFVILHEVKHILERTDKHTTQSGSRRDDYIEFNTEINHMNFWVPAREYEVRDDDGTAF